VIGWQRFWVASACHQQLCALPLLSFAWFAAKPQFLSAIERLHMIRLNNRLISDFGYQGRPL
jgi:hypothetical protein